MDTFFVKIADELNILFDTIQNQSSNFYHNDIIPFASDIDTMLTHLQIKMTDFYDNIISEPITEEYQPDDIPKYN